jgi:glucose/arabinose dehydrogenase
VEVVVDDLDGPTQFQLLDDGRFLIAQLNGDEDAKVGQVVVVSADGAKRTVLLDNLDKPTGVLFHQGAVWVMAKRSLLRATWDGADAVGPIETLIDALPFNGRSSGTLTLLADERVAYTTTGALTQQGEVVVDSGRIWAYDPATGTSERLAVGLKNAYSHALLPDGRLVTGDMSDNIDNPPPEEINLVPVDGGTANFGWPNCPAPQECADVVPPIATFPAHASPTGVALSADGLSILVVLHVPGEVVAMGLDGTNQRMVASGLDLPHTLVIPSTETGDGETGDGETGDGADDATGRVNRVLISEHGAGRIVSMPL